MTKYATLIVVLGSAAQAFAASAMVTESNQAYTVIKTNIMKSAEKMPDDGYAYQPTKEERTFAQLIGHIADAQTRICSSATGEMKPGTAGKLTAKAELVTALKASFDVCDKAFESVNDDNATKMVSFMGRGEKTMIGTLIYNTTHDNESYGTLAVYMRMKGIVPPSSEPKK
jgi:uncharacterized damage-inducible protein DinB